jgi:hypothetical protein
MLMRDHTDPVKLSADLHESQNYLVLWRIAVKNYLIDYNAQRRLIAIRDQKTEKGAINWRDETDKALVRIGCWHVANAMRNDPMFIFPPIVFGGAG